MCGEDGEFGFGYIGIQMLMRLPREDVHQAAEDLSLEIRGEPGIEIFVGKMSGRY